MLVEGLRSTGEEFVIRRELWNIGGKIEKSTEKADLRERGNIRAREFGRGKLNVSGAGTCGENWGIWGNLVGES